MTNTSGKSAEGIFQVTLLPSQEDNPIEIIASSTRAEIGPGDGQLVIGVLVSGGTVDMMVKVSDLRFPYLELCRSRADSLFRTGWSHG